MAPTPAATNPLIRLQQYGQSVWLDYIRRSLITSGELEKLIDQDGLRGMTSNPSIFEKAITGSTDYTSALEEVGISMQAVTDKLTEEGVRLFAEPSSRFPDGD